MSHFYLIAVVPPAVTGGDAIESFIDENMEKYSEHLEVDEYDHECYCLGRKARREVLDQTEKELGPFSAIRDAYWKKKNEEYIADEDNSLWQSMTKDWIKYEEDLRAARTDMKDPDDDCEECKGTGTYRSTFNPNGNWDWYVIGGRWDGTIKDNYQSSENGFNFGAQHHTLTNNSLTAKEALDSWDPTRHVPYSMLTPDGKWVAKGEMGWWGMSRGDKDQNDWNSQVKAFYADHPDHLLVGLDCHI